MQIFFMRGIPHPWTDQSNRAGSERYRHHFFIATTARSIINLVRLHFASSDSEYIASHRTEQETAHMEEVNCTVPPCMNACALCRDAVQGRCAGTLCRDPRCCLSWWVAVLPAQPPARIGSLPTVCFACPSGSYLDFT
jgi:hypothetical protein